VEIIEDIVPLYNIDVKLRLPGRRVKGVYLAPQGTPLDYRSDAEGIKYTLPELECHQMVVIDLQD
ncbi:hypothetical protein QJ48_32625, partial [Paenibacillus sp. A3]|uniref:hypothetical protein n=1 Tax=Paenibacillus sp. A3 TaxID=1337054 RepID=UPI0006D54D50